MEPRETVAHQNSPLFSQDPNCYESKYPEMRKVNDCMILIHAKKYLPTRLFCIRKYHSHKAKGYAPTQDSRGGKRHLTFSCQ